MPDCRWKSLKCVGAKSGLTDEVMGNMSTLLEVLKDWKCDVDGAMERFMGDEELYRTCLNAVLVDKSFAGLGAALEEGAVKEAFDHAHTLKGVLANMGLTPMYDITVRIVEPLRNGDSEQLLPVYEELMEAKEYLGKLIETA